MSLLDANTFPSLLLTNVQSLRPKIDELTVVVATIRPEIIILCETWLTNLVTDEEILIPSFQSYRCDRADGRKGGGVCIYVQNSVSCNQINTRHEKPACIECLWNYLPSYNLNVLSLYVPPNLCATQMHEVSEFIINSSDEVLNMHDDSKLLIAGDVNRLPTCDIEISLNLCQIVKCPTRRNAILDVVLMDRRLLPPNSLDYTHNPAESDAHLSITNNEHLPPVAIGPSIGNSDHQTVHVKSISTSAEQTQWRTVYDLRESHTNAFRKVLSSYPWHKFYRSNLSIDEKCNLFHQIIETAMLQIPSNAVEMKKTDKPWITPVLKNMINKRFEAYRRRDFPLYRHYKQKVKKEIETAKKRWASARGKNLKGLWSVVKNVMNRDSISNVESILRQYPSLSNAANAINEALARHFSESPNWTELFEEIGNQKDTDWKISLDIKDVHEFLSHLKPHKATGSDGLPPRILKETADELAEPLTHIIALSLETKTVPAIWKLSHVVPVPKCRNPTLDDLRPLSMLPTFSKILERIVLKSIQRRLIDMYGSNQFGFRPATSTLHAHIQTHDFITKSLDSPDIMAVAMITFDMSKAFDRLKHDCLIRTLLNGKLPGDFIQWCANFLMNRNQQVRLHNGSLSTSRSVTSGVPQGSVLSPYLFSAHMGSLKSCNDRSMMIKYADDVYTMLPLYKYDDYDRLVQNEIQGIENWCLSHGLLLNASKTKRMILSKPGVLPSVSPLRNTTKELSILGVTFDNNLRWNVHIDNICRKANQRLYIIRKMKSIAKKTDLLKIYYNIILSILEYNSPLFIGMNLKEQDKLEKVRKRCHRIICGFNCNCDLFTTLRERRNTQAMKVFQQMTQSEHILHHLIPPRMK